MINLNYLTERRNLFRIIKKHETVTDNPAIRIYINKTENRITFIKIIYLQLLTPETTKLLGSTKTKITKNEIGENVLHLQITEVVLVHFNVVSNDYQHRSRAFMYFLLVHRLVIY